MNLRKFVIMLFPVLFLFGCSGLKDTSLMSPEEHFNYALELYNNEDYDDAQKEFQNILIQYPGSAVNDDAQYYLGMTYLKKRQFLLAAYEFSKLIRDIPASVFVPDAQYMLAESYYQLAPPYQLEQSYTKKAIEEFQAFADFYPTNPKVEEVNKKIKELNERLAEKEYQNGIIYERMEYERAAMKYYENVAEIYHDSKFAPLALYRKIKLEESKKMFTQAINDISLFLSRYESHQYAAELKILENELTNKK